MLSVFALCTVSFSRNLSGVFYNLGAVFECLMQTFYININYGITDLRSQLNLEPLLLP